MPKNIVAFVAALLGLIVWLFSISLRNNEYAKLTGGNPVAEKCNNFARFCFGVAIVAATYFGL